MRIVGELAVRRPFPWARLLDYLGHRLVPGFERIEDGRYVRRTDGGEVRVEFRAPERLVVRAEGSGDRRDALRRVARLFDVGFDAAPVARHLRKSPALRPHMAGAAGMRPPGCWSPFELCVRTVLGQQVSVAGANTLMRRLVERCGTVTPPAVLAADLSGIGMPGKRVQTVAALARAAADGLDLEDPSWDRIEHALAALPGFGPWTRAYLAIRLGRQPDAFPHTDLGLVRNAGADSPRQLLDLAEAWRPFRAHAAIYLWSGAAPAGRGMRNNRTRS